MTEAAETPKSADTAKVSSRGAGFPVLSLPEAAKIIRDAGAYGKQHTASALAAYAGHQTANSGPWKQKAAALREWGLITSQGGESILLTDRALQIAHPESTDKAQAALRDAFRDCSLFMSIYDDLAKDKELTVAGLGNKAVTGYRVSIGSKDKFTKSFIESAAAVGLAEPMGTDKVKILAMPDDAGEKPVDDEGVDEVEDLGKPEQLRKVTRRTGTPVIEQTWATKDGEVTFSIHSNKPLAATAYAEIAKVVTAVEGLVKLLGVDEDSQDNNGTAN